MVEYDNRYNNSPWVVCINISKVSSLSEFIKGLGDCSCNQFLTEGARQAVENSINKV